MSCLPVIVRPGEWMQTAAVHPGEGLLSQPTAVARPWTRERVFVPHTRRSRYRPGSVQLGGHRPFPIFWPVMPMLQKR